ncbi:HNH endonuclease [uncultured Roseobacter sp.]|uniref:HNH endonuclease n=1 Tax=uncultured Roseobacter sp. TaxID=114847 RepID=UPI0026399C6F|nr:HNH endonuclease [uncultured Roseobacter sp.]
MLTNRVVRDRNFRKSVLRAYGERCAITGLRLINGGGRAEVEAAHIRPVGHDGPDIVSNGLALSGTAHWMFDRGLVGPSDNLTIVVSRQSNDLDAIVAMINPSGRLLAPERPANRPRLEFVTWHRENCFKR